MSNVYKAYENKPATCFTRKHELQISRRWLCSFSAELRWRLRLRAAFRLCASSSSGIFQVCSRPLSAPQITLVSPLASSAWRLLENALFALTCRSIASLDCSPLESCRILWPRAVGSHAVGGRGALNSVGYYKKILLLVRASSFLLNVVLTRLLKVT